MMNEIVSVAWLNQNKEDKNLIILNASMNKITETKSVVLNEELIPNSIFFDLKNHFSNKESDLPNTMPSVQQFERQWRKLGINNSSKIVIYDNLGVYSSPRAWWLFKTMGHNNVAVLDGGLPEWKRQKFEVKIRENNQNKSGDFTAVFNQSHILNYNQVIDNIQTKKYLVIDARSSGRFMGTQKEPREELQSGHIPNSINIPFGDVLKEGKFKSKEELSKLFEEKNNSNRSLVFSCGSGLTACIVLLANRIAGENNMTIYDGSWTEWAEKKKLFT